MVEETEDVLQQTQAYIRAPISKKRASDIRLQNAETTFETERERVKQRIGVLCELANWKLIPDDNTDVTIRLMVPVDDQRSFEFSILQVYLDTD